MYGDLPAETTANQSKGEGNLFTVEYLGEWSRNLLNQGTCFKRLEVLIFVLVREENSEQGDNDQQETQPHKTASTARTGIEPGSAFNPLSLSIKLQILFLCFHSFLIEIVGRSC